MKTGWGPVCWVRAAAVAGGLAQAHNGGCMVAVIETCRVTGRWRRGRSQAGHMPQNGSLFIDDAGAENSRENAGTGTVPVVNNVYQGGCRTRSQGTWGTYRMNTQPLPAQRHLPVLRRAQAAAVFGAAYGTG